MTLTELEIAKLAYPFRREEHDFLQGFVYISEESIGERIEKIDSEWSFNVDEMTLNGDSAVVRATLTIRGISRSGIGGNPIQREKEVKEERNGKWVGTGVYEPLPLYTQADNGVNAFKSAATDAFKRCARLFGIGRYLLSAPKEGQFDRWLKEETAAAYERLQKLQGEPKTLDTQTGEIKVEQPRPTSAPLPPQPVEPTPAPSGVSPSTPALVIVDSATDAGAKYDEMFPPSEVNAVTPDALYAKTSALFNAKAHFENWWEKHSGDLAKRTLEEAERWTKAMRWNWDKELVGAFFERANNEWDVDTQQVLTALSTAAGHDIKRTRDWDGGPVNFALGAVIAWVAKYDLDAVWNLAAERGSLGNGVQEAAEHYCTEYQKGAA